MRYVDKNGWSRKPKGLGKIHTHPNTFEGRGVVENDMGFHFNGVTYATLDEAKHAALAAPVVTEEQTPFILADHD